MAFLRIIRPLRLLRLPEYVEANAHMYEPKQKTQYYINPNSDTMIDCDMINSTTIYICIQLFLLQ